MLKTAKRNYKNGKKWLLSIISNQKMSYSPITLPKPEVYVIFTGERNEKFLNKYHNENERRIAREESHAEGKVQGMAAQKAEDEKIIQEKGAEIVRLKALLQKQDK